MGNSDKYEALPDAGDLAGSIIDTVHEALLVLDSDLRVVTASRAFYEVFKLHPDKTQGQRIYDVGDKQWDIPRLRELLETILPKNTSVENYAIEHDFPATGMRRMMMNARCYGQRADGRSIVLTIEDVTRLGQREKEWRDDCDFLEKMVHERTASLEREIAERKATEESLRSSKKLLSLAAELANLGQWEYDVHSNRFIFNDEFYSLYGTSVAREGVAMTPDVYAREMVHPDDASIVGSEIAKIMASRELDSTLKLEHRIVRRDGEVRVIAVKIKIIKDAAGNILEYYGANQDITERKQADEKVRRSREEYKNLVNNIRFGVAHIDENYRIVTVNTEITRMIAKTEKDLVGKQCFREFENREEPCAHCPGKQAMATGRSFEVETWLKKLDGSEQRPVRIQAFAVAHSVDGMAKGFVEVVEDVSERRKADKEKASLQAQLLQSDKLAAIGRLASGVAHEINNPLTIILGLSQFYGNKVETDPTLRADMKEIETAAVRCRDIVASLLAYARNNNEVFISINANEAIEKSIGLVGHQMELNKIEIRKQLDAALPPVTGNLHQLIQVFINLMTNAADAMPDGGTLLISSERSGDRLLIKFADTGQGIPAKMLKEIFDPFFTTKPVGKGTGLGLSITARIVENHQGTIRVESEVGKGTVFTLSFPTALPATGK